MNIQQLEYVLAVDKYRHFARAAEASFVTQPTLSMMIQKLEDELDAKIFDRSKQPVIPTDIGEKIITQIRQVLAEIDYLKNISNEEKNIVAGELRIGIIPTIAPYLLPMFLGSFKDKYPDVKLKISENITPTIIQKLKNGELDAGILVNPEDGDSFTDYALFTEAFVVYSPKNFKKKYLLAEDIDISELLLLEEGHCFRSQILKFCELSKMQHNNVEYSSGSLETLKNLTDRHLGITILPEMATLNFSEQDKAKIKHFASPQPIRKVSLLTHRDYIKKRLVSILIEEIKNNLPAEANNPSENVVGFKLRE
jgi:LysR family transcriptional regulator, hydrogen peroxide-inducible genes activator